MVHQWVYNISLIWCQHNIRVMIVWFEQEPFLFYIALFFLPAPVCTSHSEALQIRRKRLVCQSDMAVTGSDALVRLTSGITHSLQWHVKVPAQKWHVLAISLNSLNFFWFDGLRTEAAICCTDCKAPCKLWFMTLGCVNKNWFDLSLLNPASLSYCCYACTAHIRFTLVADLPLKVLGNLISNRCQQKLLISCRWPLILPAKMTTVASRFYQL